MPATVASTCVAATRNTIWPLVTLRRTTTTTRKAVQAMAATRQIRTVAAEPICNTVLSNAASAVIDSMKIAAQVRLPHHPRSTSQAGWIRRRPRAAARRSVRRRFPTRSLLSLPGVWCTPRHLVGVQIVPG